MSEKKNDKPLAVFALIGDVHYADCEPMDGRIYRAAVRYVVGNHDHVRHTEEDIRQLPGVVFP